MTRRRHARRASGSGPASLAASLAATLAATLMATLAAAGCGGDSAPVATSTTPTTIAVAPLSTIAAVSSSTTAVLDPTLLPGAVTTTSLDDTIPVLTIAPVASAGPDIAMPTLVPPPTAPPTAPPPTPTRLCAGVTGLPGDAAISASIVGNLDGDGFDDTVSAYTAGDGESHVFVQRGSGSGSDVALAMANADNISISFEDMDHDLGAPVQPPMVILAISVGAPGSAVATFLSLNSDGCVQQWQHSDGPFSFPIDQRGPFSGLLCDGVAGRRYYVLRTATPDGVGSVATTAVEISHTGVSVTLARLGDEAIPDGPSVQKNFGDIQNCDHPPLFP